MTLVALTAGVTRGADTYAIKLTRPVTVGQRYAVTCKVDVHDRAKVKRGGRSNGYDQRYTLELAGGLKVDAVNARTGKATGTTVTLDRLVRDGKPVFPAGTFVDEGLPVSTGHVSERSKLAEVKPVDGVPSQVIQTTLTVDTLDKGKDYRGMTVSQGDPRGDGHGDAAGRPPDAGDDHRPAVPPQGQGDRRRGCHGRRPVRQDHSPDDGVDEASRPADRQQATGQNGSGVPSR